MPPSTATGIEANSNAAESNVDRGGNFGAVTTFEFDLHPCGAMTGGYVSFGFDDLAAVLATVEGMRDTMPDELVIMIDVGPDRETGRATCAVGVAFAGPPEAARAAIGPLLEVAPPVRDEVGQKTYLVIQAMNGILPFGLRHYWKGHFLDELGPEAIAAIVRAADPLPSRSTILLEVLNGAARRVPDSSAAFGLRHAGWNVSALGIWERPEGDATVIGWARALADALEPFSSTGGGYVNYVPPDETPERVIAAYGVERFERLARVKRRYDPDNRFRFNLNIPPAG